MRPGISGGRGFYRRILAEDSNRVFRTMEHILGTIQFEEESIRYCL